MTKQELLEAHENSRRMFPPKAKMNLLELTEDDERILDKVWSELAEEKQVETFSKKPVKEAA